MAFVPTGKVYKRWDIFNQSGKTIFPGDKQKKRKSGVEIFRNSVFRHMEKKFIKTLLEHLNDYINNETSTLRNAIRTFIVDCQEIETVFRLLLEDIWGEPAAFKGRRSKEQELRDFFYEAIEEEIIGLFSEYINDYFNTEPSLLRRKLQHCAVAGQQIETACSVLMQAQSANPAPSKVKSSD